MVLGLFGGDDVFPLAGGGLSTEMCPLPPTMVHLAPVPRAWREIRMLGSLVLARSTGLSRRLAGWRMCHLDPLFLHDPLYPHDFWDPCRPP